MTKILIPASGPGDWKQFLAEPDKQWKPRFSAYILAHCWHDSDGMPPEILSVLGQVQSLKNLKAIFAIPEHKVPLPSGGRPSQNDVWVLGEASGGLVSIAVEGKVSETFGPTVGEWFENKSAVKEERLKFLCAELGLDYPPPLKARYQLFHRTVSAILEARRFRAKEAVMLVHTFSKTDEWFDDYEYFLFLFGLKAEKGRAVTKKMANDINLSFAWVHGPDKYLKA